MKATLLLTVMQNGAKRIPLGLALAVAAVTFLHQDATAAQVDLGTAADFAILGGTKITDAGGVSTIVTGDVGLPGQSITGALLD